MVINLIIEVVVSVSGSKRVDLLAKQHVQCEDFLGGGVCHSWHGKDECTTCLEHTMSPFCAHMKN